MLSREATNTNFIVFGLKGPGSNPGSTTNQASMLNITPPKRYSKLECVCAHGILNFKLVQFDPEIAKLPII
jgi:hypothetical protein